jgi:hypothetical protein
MIKKKMGKEKILFFKMGQEFWMKIYRSIIGRLNIDVGYIAMRPVKKIL